MKMLKFAGLCAVLSVASVVYAQKGVVQPSKPGPTAPPPPPVFIVDPPPERLPIPQPKPTVQLPQAQQVYVFEQKPLAGKPLVLTAEQAQAIINRFKAGYGALGSPRFLITVSRELTAPGTPGADDAQILPEVGRLFGRPLTAAGATLADSKAPAEAVIEVVISSKTVTTPEGQSFAIPEIKAKAVRASDSKILGQAASSNVTNHIPPGTLANYDVREIAEASALALMEQMAP